MRKAIIIALSATLFFIPAIADADGGGAVSGPTVGKSSPPPTAGSEVGVPQARKRPLASSDMTPGGSTNDLAAKGIETSTSAQGGQAESTRNGALSTPADSNRHKAKHHEKAGPAAGS